MAEAEEHVVPDEVVTALVKASNKSRRKVVPVDPARRTKIQALAWGLRHGLKSAAKRYGIPHDVLHAWTVDPNDVEADVVRQWMRVELEDRLRALALHTANELLVRMRRIKDRDLVKLLGTAIAQLKAIERNKPLSPKTVQNLQINFGTPR